MVGSRTVTAAVGVVLSVAVSAVLWWYLGTLVFFLLVPFVPFVFRRRGDSSTRPRSRRRTCPECGFSSTDPSFEYCPRDGARLRG